MTHGKKGKGKSQHPPVQTGPAAQPQVHPDSAQPAEREVQGEGQRESHRRIWEVRIQAALLLVTIGLGGIYWRQLVSMQGAVEEGRRSADAATESANIARQQTDLANRPWVRADLSVSKPFVVDGRGGHLGLALEYQNVGSSPASYVTTFAKIFLLEVPRITTQVTDEVAEVCKAAHDLEGNSQRGAPSALTIFPHDKRSDAIDTNIGRDQLDAADASYRRDGPVGLRPPMVAVCIFYRFAYDLSRSDTTAYVFTIGRDEQGGTILAPSPWPLGGSEVIGSLPTPLGGPVPTVTRAR